MARLKELEEGGRFLKRDYRSGKVIKERYKKIEDYKRSKPKEAIVTEVNDSAVQCLVCKSTVGIEYIKVRGTKIALCTEHITLFLKQLNQFFKKELGDEGVYLTDTEVVSERIANG